MSTNNMYIGIDVGANGALVCISNNNVYSLKFNLKEYVSFLKKNINNNILILIEKIHAVKGNGLSSTFSFGQRYGEIIGMLEALGLEYELVRPQEWKKHFGLIGSNKKQSCVKALELEPTLQCKGKRGGMLDGICDAYLIAIYLKDKYGKHNL